MTKNWPQKQDPNQVLDTWQMMKTVLFSIYQLFPVHHAPGEAESGSAQNQDHPTPAPTCSSLPPHLGCGLLWGKIILAKLESEDEWRNRPTLEIASFLEDAMLTSSSIY